MTGAHRGLLSTRVTGLHVRAIENGTGKIFWLYIHLLGQRIRKAALPMNTEERHTAVLLDQHPLWLDAVEQVLARIGVEVVGKATRASRALELVETHRPEVLVTGIDMPVNEMDGIACLRRAR